MNFRRPIPKFRPKPLQSLRYTLVHGGAAIRYPDGREICLLQTVLGRRLYTKRVEEMVQRQNFRCSLCGRRLSPGNATYDHDPRRKMGSAFRDDRIIDDKGKWLSGAAHWICNGVKG
jgi:hypothetical protein